MPKEAVTLDGPLRDVSLWDNFLWDELYGLISQTFCECFLAPLTWAFILG